MCDRQQASPVTAAPFGQRPGVSVLPTSTGGTRDEVEKGRAGRFVDSGNLRPGVRNHDHLGDGILPHRAGHGASVGSGNLEAGGLRQHAGRALPAGDRLRRGPQRGGHLRRSEQQPAHAHDVPQPGDLGMEPGNRQVDQPHRRRSQARRAFGRRLRVRLGPQEAGALRWTGRQRLQLRGHVGMGSRDRRMDEPDQCRRASRRPQPARDGVREVDQEGAALRWRA